MDFLDYPENYEFIIGENSDIMLGCSTGLLTIYQRISCNPDYANWLKINNYNLQDLYDAKIWYIDFNDAKNGMPERYYLELMQYVKHLALIVNKAEEIPKPSYRPIKTGE